jgi:hypothetical protein
VEYLARACPVGYGLYREVRDNAPADWTPTMTLVACMIADDANDVTRKSWISLTELARQCRIKTVSGVRQVLLKLAESGYEFRVQIATGKDDRPVFAAKGHSLDFRVPKFEASGIASVTPIGASSQAPIAEPEPVDNLPKAPESSPIGASSQAPLPSEPPLKDLSSAVGEKLQIVSTPVDPAVAYKDKIIGEFRGDRLARSRSDLAGCRQSGTRFADLCPRCALERCVCNAHREHLEEPMRLGDALAAMVPMRKTA